jgi:hypothetical protein
LTRGVDQLPPTYLVVPFWEKLAGGDPNGGFNPTLSRPVSGLVDLTPDPNHSPAILV